MNLGADRPQSWVLADGSASISAAALFAVIINISPGIAGLWGLAFLRELTNKEDGVIIVASMLLFPSAFIIYGVAKMIFAAKEAVEKKAMERGQKAERQRIERELEALEKSGINIPPEITRIIARESSPLP